MKDIKTTKIIIEVKGGVVQNVYSTDDTIQVEIQDFDDCCGNYYPDINFSKYATIY
jgi:hypothetical protein